MSRHRSSFVRLPRCTRLSFRFNSHYRIILFIVNMIDYHERPAHHLWQQPRLCMPAPSSHKQATPVWLPTFTFAHPHPHTGAPPTFDPPSKARWNSDFRAAPLANTSTIDDCVSLCCSTPACVAFSFNHPQPSAVCLGCTCCAQNGVCCMLKNGPGTVKNNTFSPGQVSEPPMQFVAPIVKMHNTNTR